jgi:hypothetical protein
MWTTRIAKAIQSCERKGYEFDREIIINTAIVIRDLEGLAAKIAYNCIMGQINDGATAD